MTQGWAGHSPVSIGTAPRLATFIPLSSQPGNCDCPVCSLTSFSHLNASHIDDPQIATSLNLGSPLGKVPCDQPQEGGSAFLGPGPSAPGCWQSDLIQLAPLSFYSLPVSKLEGTSWFDPGSALVFLWKPRQHSQSHPTGISHQQWVEGGDEMEMILSTEPWNKLWAQQLKEQGLQKKTGWNSLVLVTPHSAGSAQITKSCQASVSTSVKWRS